MARAFVRHLIGIRSANSHFVLVSDALVTITDHLGDTEVEIFATEDGATPIDQPMRSNLNGEIEFWTERTPEVVDAHVSADALTSAGGGAPVTFNAFVDPIPLASPPGPEMQADQFEAFAAGLETETTRALAAEAAIVAEAAAVRPPAIRKTAAQTVNNSTAEVDDIHLRFPIGVGEIWHAHFMLHVLSGASGATSDFKAGLSLPSGATVSGFVVGPTTTAASAAGASGANRNLGSTGAAAGVGALDNAPVLIEVKATITNGATAGTVILRWAQSFATVSDTTVMAGSKLFRERLT